MPAWKKNTLAEGEKEIRRSRLEVEAGDLYEKRGKKYFSQL